MRRFWFDRVERVEINSEPNKRLPLTRSLASRGAGTETGKAGLDSLEGLGVVRGLPKACAFGTEQILVKHSLTIDAKWLTERARQNVLNAAGGAAAAKRGTPARGTRPTAADFPRFGPWMMRNVPRKKENQGVSRLGWLLLWVVDRKVANHKILKKS